MLRDLYGKERKRLRKVKAILRKDHCTRKRSGKQMGKSRKIILRAPVDGTVIPLKDVPDLVFAENNNCFGKIKIDFTI